VTSLAKARVKLYSQPGNDPTYRFPLIVEAIAKVRSRSCIIDGETVACGEDGIASFDRIRYRHNDDSVFLYAFDLIEFNGDDLRRDPLNVRKGTLASVLARAAPGLRVNEHLGADGPDVFHHACKLGLEGIVCPPHSWIRSFVMRLRSTCVPGLASSIPVCSGPGNGLFSFEENHSPSSSSSRTLGEPQATDRLHGDHGCRCGIHLEW
jgi:hypothetical protein